MENTDEKKKLNVKKEAIRAIGNLMVLRIWKLKSNANACLELFYRFFLLVPLLAGRCIFGGPFLYTISDEYCDTGQELNIGNIYM
ncbi:hypothetical protein RCL_jg23698.t1 [Rhizophagus clarus]|uniref:Uncharacterized protein n=1 Tax=Rhizophagus clarus TaxID=94130 RepID=A0A8H3L6B1_9GLOM|nr:hypothetical protein RCL_jg23698.t1 [Rhizophagus clarus]